MRKNIKKIGRVGWRIENWRGKKIIMCKILIREIEEKFEIENEEKKINDKKELRNLRRKNKNR